MIGSFKYGWFKVDSSTTPSFLYYTKYTFNGEIMTGGTANDYVGQRVSISSAGDVWAAGCPNYINNSYRGIIYIQRNNTFLGSIEGPGAAGYVGSTMSMNASGSRIATTYRDGSPGYYIRVYKHNGGTSWINLGQDIHNTIIATALSMNGEGNVYGAGYFQQTVDGVANTGSVRVFELSTHPLTANIWVQRGSTIYGAPSSRLGNSCSINKAGDILAIGAPYTSSIGSKIGSVSTFAWDGSSWNIKGSPISGLEREQFGYTVALNYAGDRLAIGVPGRTRTSGGSGQVLVYDWNGTDWSQLGSSIESPVFSGSFGNDISMNAVGDLLIVGTPYATIDGKNQVGSTHIFQWYENNWVNYVPIISGVAASDWFGTSVAMDGVGNHIVIGSPGYDNVSPNRGRARRYTLT